VLPSLVNYRLQSRRSAHPQPPWLLPSYILTSLLPCFLFPSSRDEKPVTATPLQSALTKCDARNSFRFCFCENCRVSMRSPDFSTIKPSNRATRFDLSPFFSHSCALFCTFLHVFMCFRTLCKKPPGVGYPPLSRRLKLKSTSTELSPSCGQPGRYLPQVTDHGTRVTLPPVAALPSGCYDLVFHDPC